MAHVFTDQNFDAEVMKADVPVLVDFWAPWCGPCKLIGPIVEAMATEMDGKGAKIGKMNVDENANVPGQYGIMSIPTMIIFKNGGPVEQIVGVQPKEKLVALLKKHM
jgi:thioredoxin 1